MRTFITFFVSALFIPIMGTTARGQDGSGIFISEYFEGLDKNEAIEIYNGNNAGATIDLNRLRVRRYADGSSTPTVSFRPDTAEDGSTTTLAWNTTFVIYHTLFDSPSTNLPNVPTSRRVRKGGVTGFNGDDAIVLQYKTNSGDWVTVDVFGEQGFDPGPEWGSLGTGTKNNGLLRKPSINTGRPNGVFVPGDHFDPASGDPNTKTTSLPILTMGDHVPDLPLPVQISSFAGTYISANNVQLDWTTISEVNNYGFFVERGRANEHTFSELPNSFTPGHGTTVIPHQYAYTDNLANGETWYYRLKQVDLDGSIHYTDEILVSTVTSVFDEVPAEFSLYQNYPNPFNPSTQIRFSVENSGPAALDVFNVVGEQVATLFSGFAEAGKQYSATFNPDNLPNGAYFYKFTSNGKSSLRKMLLLK